MRNNAGSWLNGPVDHHGATVDPTIHTWHASLLYGRISGEPGRSVAVAKNRRMARPSIRRARENLNKERRRENKKLGLPGPPFGRQRHRGKVACTIDRSQSTGYEPIMARRPAQVEVSDSEVFFFSSSCHAVWDLFWEAKLS